MATLNGRLHDNTFGDLLHIENTNNGVDATLRVVESGNGNESALSISTLGVQIAGFLTVTGATEFNQAPTVNGDTIYYPGNQGVSAGLDAGTLNGIAASGFAQPGQALTITAAWEIENTFTVSTDTNVDGLVLKHRNGVNEVRSFFSSTSLLWRPRISGVPVTTRDFFYNFDTAQWNFDDSLTVGGNAVLTTASSIDADTLNSQQPSFYLNAGNLTGTLADARLPAIFSGKEFSGNVLLQQGAELQIRDSSNTARALVDIAGVTGQLGSLEISCSYRSAGELLLDSGTGAYRFNNGSSETQIDIENASGALTGRLVTEGESLRIQGLRDTVASLQLRVGSANELALQASANGSVRLYYNGLSRIATLDTSADGVISGAEVADAGGVSLRPVGFNNAAPVAVANTTDFTKNWCGLTVVKSSNSTVTLNLTNVADNTIPDGAMINFINPQASGDLIIVSSGGVTMLQLISGQAPNSVTTSTIGPGGVVSIWKRANDQYYIWGSELS